MRIPILILSMIFAACGSADPPAVAVDGVTFSERELLGISDERRETLAYLTALGLAVADSSTAELGAPRVEQWLDDRRTEILAAELTLEKHDVSDAVLESRYMTDPEWELTVRHILFFSERWRSPDHRAEAMAKAERAMERLRGGADFAETAAALSEEPGAEGRAGLLTPGREGAWVPEFWTAAVALAPGEISRVTETQYGYHILRLEDRQVVPFAEARSTLARRIANQIEDPRAVLDDWLDERGVQGDDERAAAALAEASRRGIEVPEGERAELQRRWDDRVYRWGLAFGFRYGFGPEQVAAAALEALSESGQNAQIARSELRSHAEVFDLRYDIVLASETE